MKTETISSGNQTLVCLLEAMQKIYMSGFTKTPSYEILYKQYLKRVCSIEVSLEELEKAADFLHTAPYSVGLTGFEEAMRIQSAKDILLHRTFLLRQFYIVATLPEKEEEHPSFLKKVEKIAEERRNLSNYICVSLWEDYQKINPIKDLLLGSHKTTKGSLSRFSVDSSWDDHGVKPNINYNFIHVLKDKGLPELSSVIFITDDPYVSAHLLGSCKDYSDNPNPAISQALKENCNDVSSLRYGYGTIIILDFPNKEFLSVI